MIRPDIHEKFLAIKTRAFALALAPEPEPLTPFEEARYLSELAKIKRRKLPRKLRGRGGR